MNQKPCITIDDQNGRDVAYKHTVTGTVTPPDALVQVLVLSWDGQWYLQKDATVDSNGCWSADCTFGYENSAHVFSVVAFVGEKMKVGHVPAVPCVDAATTIMVNRPRV